MKTNRLKELLESIWNKEIGPEKVWKIIDDDREHPDTYSKEYWLPLEDEVK